MVPVDSAIQSRCRLCLGVKPLQNSHLLPKALYRLLRTAGKKNPSPVWFNRNSAWTSSSQFADQLLCSDCEQLFHRNGEDWVLRQCNRGKGRFCLQDEVFRIPSLRSTSLCQASPFRFDRPPSFPLVSLLLSRLSNWRALQPA